MSDTLPASPPSEGVQKGAQYAALCWRMHRGKVEVLLITSRETGRWVIPKGWPMNGFTPAEAAAREAWEEAGVEGQVAANGLGQFDYEKMLGPKGSRPCQVEVFALRVARLSDKFPERKERRRKWFAAEKAARKVNEPQLRALLQKIADDPGVATAATPALATA